jgi:pimeloyl-ACP methyl ester carboxylesterase
VRLVAEALGNAELRVFERTGHSIFLQRADRFNTTVLRFLRERFAER